MEYDTYYLLEKKISDGTITPIVPSFCLLKYATGTSTRGFYVGKETVHDSY